MNSTNNHHQTKKEKPLILKLIITLLFGVSFAGLAILVLVINNMYLSGGLAFLTILGIFVFKIRSSKKSKY